MNIKENVGNIKKPRVVVFKEELLLVFPENYENTNIIQEFVKTISDYFDENEYPEIRLRGSISLYNGFPYTYLRDNKDETYMIFKHESLR